MPSGDLSAHEPAARGVALACGTETEQEHSGQGRTSAGAAAGARLALAFGRIKGFNTRVSDDPPKLAGLPRATRPNRTCPRGQPGNAGYPIASNYNGGALRRSCHNTAQAAHTDLHPAAMIQHSRIQGRPCRGVPVDRCNNTPHLGHQGGAGGLYAHRSACSGLGPLRAEPTAAGVGPAELYSRRQLRSSHWQSKESACSCVMLTRNRPRLGCSEAALVHC